MSSSSSYRPRVSVLRAADVTRDTVAIADLGTVRSPAARDLVVDRRLVDDALSDGFRAGYEAGFETGLAEAAQAAAERERSRAQQSQSVVSQLAAAAEILREREGTAVEEIEDQVALAAFRIAEMLVGHELASSASPGADAIARALPFAPRDGMVTAYLHPEDADTLGDPAAVVPGRALAVVRDASLTPGDAIVEVAGCRIDARIDAALDRIRELLGVGSAS
jgi:flagellar biosynthesis/type III secretory pathway protein FliH